jgi:hypothetical protein
MKKLSSSAAIALKYVIWNLLVENNDLSEVCKFKRGRTNTNDAKLSRGARTRHLLWETSKNFTKLSLMIVKLIELADIAKKINESCQLYFVQTFGLKKLLKNINLSKIFGCCFKLFKLSKKYL